MNILIIEDDNEKYNSIKTILNNLFDNVCITLEKSRNAGLYSILQHTQKEFSEPYDLVVCDNYLPIFNDSQEISPFAMDIVYEIRERFHLLDLPIIICSSDFDNTGDFYFIKYDSSVDLTDDFAEVINDIERKRR